MIERKIDKKGRLLIPIELRDKLNINYGDTVNLFIKDNAIEIRKIDENYCKICGKKTYSDAEKLFGFCEDCLRKISGK